MAREAPKQTADSPEYGRCYDSRQGNWLDEVDYEIDSYHGFDKEYDIQKGDVSKFRLEGEITSGSFKAAACRHIKNYLAFTQIAPFFLAGGVRPGAGTQSLKSWNRWREEGSG